MSTLGAAQHDGRQLDAFDRDGYLVLEGFTSRDACAELIDRAVSLVDAFDAEGHRSVFTTSEQTRTSDEYFLSSGGQIRFFFEAEAFDDTGRLRQAKRDSFNKIGHAQHDLDPVFDAFSRAPGLGTLVAQLGLAEPLLVQSMYIFKNPFIGGEVTCHQDATFLYSDPISCVGLWFALEDSKIENGCLWAIPGGHRMGLRNRFLRNISGSSPESDAAGTRFETYGPAIEADGVVPLEVSAGTLVVLHGLLPHLSGPNRSPKSRHAYSVHCIDGAADYPDDNWLLRPESLPLRGF